MPRAAEPSGKSRATRTVQLQSFKKFWLENFTARGKNKVARRAADESPPDAAGGPRGPIAVSDRFQLRRLNSCDFGGNGQKRLPPFSSKRKTRTSVWCESTEPPRKVSNDGRPGRQGRICNRKTRQSLHVRTQYFVFR